MASASGERKAIIGANIYEGPELEAAMKSALRMLKL
jgi:hypothetical protein